MDKEEIKKFKEAILSSGIILEAEISDKLSKNNWIVVEEIPFYIENKITSKIEKSTTEVIGRRWFKINEKESLHIDINAECKYRKPGTQWAFFTNEKVKDYIERPESSPPLCVFCFKRNQESKIGKELAIKIEKTLKEILKEFPTASRSVEIKNGKPIRAEISNACEQLMKSTKIWREQNVKRLVKLSIDNKIAIILPIIVTNAKILHFEEVKIEDIIEINGENIGEKCKEVKKILYLYQNPEELRIEQDPLSDRLEHIFIPIIKNEIFEEEIERIRKKLIEVLKV